MGEYVSDPGQGPAAGGDAAVNREAWTEVNAGYTGDHALGAWAALEITGVCSTCQNASLACSARWPAWTWSSLAAVPRTFLPGWPGGVRGQSVSI